MSKITDSPKRFSGKNVLVTGASRGIGRTTALAFSREGAQVILNYHRSREQALETVSKIGAEGGRGLAFAADLTVPQQIDEMVSGIENQTGNVDILVCNAGALVSAPFNKTTLEDLNYLWAANVSGHYYLAQKISRHMIAKQAGNIIFISSILARMAISDRTAYCAVKGAIESLTRAMALDLAPYRIRVNAVAPGLIETEMLLSDENTRSLMPEIISHIPMKRLGSPEEIAHTILFIASDEAQYLNGTVLQIDGALGAREPGPVSIG